MLVILGNKQKYGLDYKETFAPVGKMTTVRSLLVVAAMQGWFIHQIDVKNAFLHCELEETVYMTFPLGYEKEGFRFDVSCQGELKAHDSTSTQVCQIWEPLYGLKQSPRQWLAKLCLVLKVDGFVKSKSDHSLSTKQSESSFTAILAYVNDMSLTGNNMKNINQVRGFLNS